MSTWSLKFREWAELNRWFSTQAACEDQDLQGFSELPRGPWGAAMVETTRDGDWWGLRHVLCCQPYQEMALSEVDLTVFSQCLAWGVFFNAAWNRYVLLVTEGREEAVWGDEEARGLRRVPLHGETVPGHCHLRARKIPWHPKCPGQVLFAWSFYFTVLVGHTVCDCLHHAIQD